MTTLLTQDQPRSGNVATVTPLENSNPHYCLGFLKGQRQRLVHILAKIKADLQDTQIRCQEFADESDTVDRHCYLTIRDRIGWATARIDDAVKDAAREPEGGVA